MAIRHWHLDSGAIRVNNFPENEIQIAIPIHLFATYRSIAIDSEGVKLTSGQFYLSAEMIKHLKSAFLEAWADTPSATDAVVNVELYNETDGSVVTSVQYSGDSGHKTSADIASNIKTLAGKVLSGRINVVTASATSGATQGFRSIVLRLVLGIS